MDAPHPIATRALRDRATPAERADALLGVLAAASARGYLGEPVSQLEHALQAAARATSAGASDELVLAALFHDIGHLVAGDDAPAMNGFGVADHETVGAELLLAYGCSPAVAEPVREHVRAKRYLCARKPGYRARLSAASRATLAQQGGPMTEPEAAAYAMRHDLAHILAVRAWDEAAKQPDADVPGLEHYRAILIAHLEGESR